MDPIKIIATEDTPNVILDPAADVFEISGRSLPEDVSSFYNPIVDWISEYGKNPKPKTVFCFKLSYFNTASSKLLLDILMKLEDLKNNGCDITINWFYPDDDEDMQEAGEEYADIVDLPFEMISYPG